MEFSCYGPETKVIKDFWSSNDCWSNDYPSSITTTILPWLNSCAVDVQLSSTDSWFASYFFTLLFMRVVLQSVDRRAPLWSRQNPSGHVKREVRVRIIFHCRRMHTRINISWGIRASALTRAPNTDTSESGFASHWMVFGQRELHNNNKSTPTWHRESIVVMLKNNKFNINI